MKKQIRIISFVLALVTLVSLATVLFRKDAKAPSSNVTSSDSTNADNSDNITEEEKEYYMNAPGSSIDNIKDSEYAYDVPNPEEWGPSFFSAECLDVDCNVLYWNGAFYGSNCNLKMDFSSYIVPFEITTNYGYLHEVKIHFSSQKNYEEYSKHFVCDNSLLIDFDDEGRFVTIIFGNISSLSHDEECKIELNLDGKLRKGVIDKIEVYTWSD